MPGISHPRPTPSRIWGWMETKSKIFYYLFNIHEFKVRGRGGGGEKGERESHELSNLGFQSNPEEASVPDCSLSFV